MPVCKVALVAVVIGIAFQVGRYVGYATGYDEGHATPEVQIVSGRCGPPEPPTTDDNPGVVLWSHSPWMFL